MTEPIYVSRSTLEAVGAVAVSWSAEVEETAQP